MKTTAVCLAGLLAGCASSIQVEEVGARPEAGVIGALPMAAGLGATPELVEGLRAAGVGDGARSDAPYVLDVSYSERPVQVGAYAGAWSSDQDGAEPWLATPAKRRPWTPRQLQFCTLSVRILDAAAGAERYEVRASARGRGPSCGQDPAVLPAAVAARLTEASD
jgi:hypothetical protein